MPTKDELPDAGEFAARLRKVLTAKGFADRGGQERLAKLFGVKPPTVSAWLSGNHLPSTRKAQRMCTIWDLSFEWLYWGKGKGPSFAPGIGAYEISPQAPGRVRDQAEPTADELGMVAASLITALAANIPAAATSFAEHLRNRAAAEGASLKTGLLAELLGIVEQDRRKGAKAS